VPSSTSSFSRTIPAGSWMRIWLCAVLASALALCALELFWRSRGHAPAVVDDKDLWAQQRERLEMSDPRTLILLGDSRMQLDFSLETFRKMYPDYRIVDLTINRISPIPVLQDLAEDKKCQGLILCSTYAEQLGVGQHDHETQAYVDFYRKRWTLNQDLNATLATWFHQRLTVIDPYLNLRALMATRHLPGPNYLTIGRDRSYHADYTRLDIREHRRKRVELAEKHYRNLVVPSPSEWLREVQPVDFVG
jgi:hypothetical protein